MKNSRYTTSLALCASLFLTFALVGCDKGGDKGGAGEKPAATSGTSAKAVTVEIEATDQMTFNKKTIEVKAGQKVKLVLKHVGKMPVTAMGHNVVILKEGVDAKAFAAAATKAGPDAQYIPADKKGDIIAHTKLIGGGETAEVEFTAPKAGSYTFICSFPGHFAIMQGQLVVK